MNEDDGLATMMIGVLSGDISNKVSLLISLLSGSANGKYIMMMLFYPSEYLKAETALCLGAGNVNSEYSPI